MQNSELISWIIERCNCVLFGQGNVTTLGLSSASLDKALANAAWHGVLPILMKDVEENVVGDIENREIVLKWFAVSEKSKKDFKYRLSLMEHLAQEFKKADLDVMFLKGATLARLYPYPECRVSSDIDYYMYGRSQESIEVLSRMGIQTSEYFNHHTQANYNGILLENHYDFLDRDNHSSNRLLDDELKALASEEGKKYSFSFDNSAIDNAFCMSPTMNAIFIIRHMAGHFFAESVSLRMLYDWALFLEKDSKDVNWERVFALYEKSGLITFVRIVQGILQKKFGLKFEGLKIVPANDSIIEKVWESIMNPPQHNPYCYNSVRYLLFESKVFWDNRWKHRLVYPNESYMSLFVNYVSLYLKKKINV